VLLPARKEKGLRGHHAALPFDKIGAFMVTLRERPAMAARALAFLILTAARTSEVLLARWSEIDLDRAMWTVPASRMKMKREHRVPLSLTIY
jgi:integrase